MLKTIDLFCGCGGLSLGFQNAGFDVVAAFDKWEEAIEIYSMNFKHPVFQRDLSSDEENIKLLRKFSPELIIGGPPCQDFSIVGKRDESLGRADLTINFSQIVAELKPKFFVMENVDRIQKSKALIKAEAILRKAGYGLTKTVLDASLCGVPQIRKRFFMIGELNGTDNFLENTLKTRLSAHRMTIRQYLGNKLGVEHYYRHPRSYKRRAIFGIDEPSPTVRGCNRPVPGGYPGHPADKVSISEKVRPLTTKERSYIQTFPEEFSFVGSKSDLESMIGNAVPVKLAEYVANCLKTYIAQYDRRISKTKKIVDNEICPVKRKQIDRIKVAGLL